MADTFKLPISSYEELIKIIQAYSTGKEGQSLSLGDLQKSSGGMATTVISGNNGFLLELELISAGKAKTPTANCIKLGRAYIHSINEDAILVWRELIEENEFLNRMISALRIRNGMDRANFINHIIYSSGLDANKSSKTGAGAVIDILKYSQFVDEKDGKIVAAAHTTVQPTQEVPKVIASDLSANVSKCELENSKYVQALPPQAICTTSTYQVILNLNLNGSIDDIDTLATKVKDFLKTLTE